MKPKLESRLLGGVLVAQLCLTIWDTMDCIWPGSFVHGILQAGILECVVYPFSRGYSQPRNQTLVSHITGRYFNRININNLRYADDITIMVGSKEELKSLLMKVKEESEKASLKLSIQKIKIMASSPIFIWQIDGEKNVNNDRLYFLGLQNHYGQ